MPCCCAGDSQRSGQPVRCCCFCCLHWGREGLIWPLSCLLQSLHTTCCSTIYSSPHLLDFIYSTPPIHYPIAFYFIFFFVIDTKLHQWGRDSCGLHSPHVILVFSFPHTTPPHCSLFWVTHYTIPFSTSSTPACLSVRVCILVCMCVYKPACLCSKTKLNSL